MDLQMSIQSSSLLQDDLEVLSREILLELARTESIHAEAVPALQAVGHKGALEAIGTILLHAMGSVAFERLLGALVSFFQREPTLHVSLSRVSEIEGQMVTETISMHDVSEENVAATLERIKTTFRE